MLMIITRLWIWYSTIPLTSKFQRPWEWSLHKLELFLCLWQVWRDPRRREKEREGMFHWAAAAAAASQTGAGGQISGPSWSVPDTLAMCDVKYFFKSKLKYFWRIVCVWWGRWRCPRHCSHPGPHHYKSRFIRRLCSATSSPSLGHGHSQLSMNC